MGWGGMGQGKAVNPAGSCPRTAGCQPPPWQEHQRERGRESGKRAVRSVGLSAQQSAGAEKRAAHLGPSPGPCSAWDEQVYTLRSLELRLFWHQGKGTGARPLLLLGPIQIRGGKGLGPATFMAKSALGVLIRQRLLLDTWHLLTDYCCH